MSASLVGSEMCIRDSPSEMPSLGGWILRRRSLGRRLHRRSGPASAPEASVSYTHLTLPTICSV
eukprot:535080-Alexandrium_andersonii.AAC.1